MTEEKLLPTQPGPAPVSVARDQDLALATGLRCERGADVGEGLVGVGAEGRDGGDAHHDDQGQHDGVLDRRRAIFLLQKRHQTLRDATHLKLRWVGWALIAPNRSGGALLRTLRAVRA